jgi:hypothetical protein
MQAATAQQPVVAPAPPAAPGVSGEVISVPATRAGVRQLTARRDEISRQITNVKDRREEVAQKLRVAVPGADRAGLEQQVAVLDQRIVQLENDLNSSGRELIALRGLVGTTQVPSPPEDGTLNSEQITGISIVFTLAVLMPLSIAWARAIFRRAKHAAEQPSPELQRRLERMEEGIEAIAIEVERISEGQRFVSKLLGEGAAQPINAASREREPARTEGRR